MEVSVLTGSRLRKRAHMSQGLFGSGGSLTSQQQEATMAGGSMKSYG